jgi:hypothetical protein
MTTPAACRTLLVAYEITEQAPARSELAAAIMGLGHAWARPLETVWVLRTERSAAEIEEFLAPFLGEDDGLMVQETRGEARFTNAGLRWFRPRRPACGDATDQVAPVLSFTEARERLDRAA